jgi:multidrug efflux pump subunit AcrA (membrane-fusion protein)
MNHLVKCCLGLVLAGAVPVHGAPKNAEVSSYKVGHGLHISPAAWAALDLQLIDVEERPLRAERQALAQVFRADTARTPEARIQASALVEPTWAAWADTGTVAEVVHPRDGDRMTGRVRLLDRQTQEATGRVELILDILDPPHPLRAGDFLDIILHDPEERTALVVPASALLRTWEGDFVYAQNGSYLLRTPVRTGAADSDHVEIVDGLFPGDRVAVRPVESLWLIELRFTKGGGHTH